MTHGRIHQLQLPFVGMSHEFIGMDHGNVGISFFVVIGEPGGERPCTSTITTRSYMLSRAAQNGELAIRSMRPSLATCSSSVPVSHTNLATPATDHGGNEIFI